MIFERVRNSCIAPAFSKKVKQLCCLRHGGPFSIEFKLDQEIFGTVIERFSHNSYHLIRWRLVLSLPDVFVEIRVELRCVSHPP